MSDIKVGDLVVVTRPTRCCNKYGAVGNTFIVENIFYNVEGICSCGFKSITTGVKGGNLKSHYGVSIYRVIKIDPPALDESTESERELTA